VGSVDAIAGACGELLQLQADSLATRVGLQPPGCAAGLREPRGLGRRSFLTRSGDGGAGIELRHCLARTQRVPWRSCCLSKARASWLLHVRFDEPFYRARHRARHLGGLAVRRERVCRWPHLCASSSRPWACGSRGDSWSEERRGPPGPLGKAHKGHLAGTAANLGVCRG